MLLYYSAGFVYLVKHQIFACRSCVSSLPDYMDHRDFMADDHHRNSYETRRGLFDFDTKSVWQREAEDKENAEKKKVEWRGTL